MTPASLTQEMGPAVIGQGFAGLLGALLALVVGVMLLQGRRVPAAAAGLAVALAPLTGALVAAWSLRIYGAGAPPDALLHGMVAALGNKLVGVFFAGPAAGFLLLFAAVTGARRGPRRLRPAALGLGLALVAAAAPIVNAVVNDDPRYPVVRGLLYLGVGVVAAVAMLAGDPDEGAGPEAGAAAGAALPIVVAAGEASGRALMLVYLLVGAPDGAPDEKLGRYVLKALEVVVEPAVPWAWLAIGAAVAAGAVAVSGARGDPRRTAGIASAGVCWVIAPLIYALGAPTSAQLTELLQALP